MSELMTPISLANIIERVTTEYEKCGTVFGVSQIWKAPEQHKISLYGKRPENLCGPAAGPHTQLAQNIIAAYAAGARYFELKTVQVMDGMEMVHCISRPCIKADDEAYNCEWSTELTVPQAMEEYHKAWQVIKILAERYGLGSPDGYLFDMSVGYDLAGISSPKIDAYIEGMRDISDSITVSTLHGCPPQEIESIATYLITMKKLNTFVKCNPTLLGYTFVRETMDAMGYDYLVFDDAHFQNDLQYKDALPMFHRLMELAQKNGVTFGVKLSNTFPVNVTRNELPSQEMYMSGRSLFPLTSEMARRLTHDFEGRLRISYSGGADIHSLEKLLDTGIYPVTMATTLLKPGGYNRLCQLANIPCHDTAEVDEEKITKIAQEARTDAWYLKPIKSVPHRKSTKKVPLFDCFTAPCRDGCPIHQDIPAYVRMMGEGRTLDALRIITERNPLPNITAIICPHPCESRCTRSYYEGPVDIRICKFAATLDAWDELMAEISVPQLNGKKAAIIGGGPAGLACAYFLARSGWRVTVFEKGNVLGGIVRKAIPEFRIPDAAINKDMRLCAAMGVQFELGKEITDLPTGYDAVILAIGAGKPGNLRLDYGTCQNALPFLADCKQGIAQPGKHVAVIGGGNTAMDTARAAKRCPGVEKVSLVYRRDKRNMPADEEELLLALADGVEFQELLSPIGQKNGILACERMVLGEPDENGRRKPQRTGEFAEVLADTVIAAVGEQVDSEFYRAFGVPLDEDGLPIFGTATQESTVGLYVIGDGARGPQTVVSAIADATRAARAIAGVDFEKYTAANKTDDDTGARAKKGIFCINHTTCSERVRCLECATVCECCVDVCPNRANISVTLHGRRQIVHIDGMCNECGNCTAFCPYDSAPYRDKFTLFWSKEDFRESANQGFFHQGNKRFLIRYDGEEIEVNLTSGNGGLPGEVADLIRTVGINHPGLEF